MRFADAALETYGRFSLPPYSCSPPDVADQNNLMSEPENQASCLGGRQARETVVIVQRC